MNDTEIMGILSIVVNLMAGGVILLILVLVIKEHLKTKNEKTY